MKSWKLFAMSFFTIVCFSTTDAKAGNYCGSSGYCGAPSYYPSYSYQAPTQYETRYVDRVQYVDRVVPVAYPVPFTVAVPVVSYIWNGSGQYAPTFNAQMANPAPQIQNTQPQQQQQQMAPQPQAMSPGAFTDAQIDMIIDRIEQRIMQRQAQAAAPRATKPTATATVSETSNPPPVANDDPAAILNIKRGKDNKSCAACHTGRSAKKIQIFSARGELTRDPKLWQKIYDKVFDGDMPPEAEKNPDALLSDAEVERLRVEWNLPERK